MSSNLSSTSLYANQLGGVTPAFSCSSTSNTSNRASCSANSEQHLLPEDHPLDRLRSRLIAHGLVDAFGNPTPLLDGIPIGGLSQNIKDRIEGFYTKSRTVTFTASDRRTYSFIYTLKELFNFAAGRLGFPTSLELIGGAVLPLLGEDFMLEYLVVLVGDEAKGWLCDRSLSQLFKPAVDEDIRPYLPNCTWDDLQNYGSGLIDFFAYKLAKAYNYAFTQQLRDMVRGAMFHKLYHLPPKKELIPPDFPLHNFTLSPKDDCRTEICLTERISREHLFLHDAMAIDFTLLIHGATDYIFLKSDLPTVHWALISRLLGVVDADNIQGINHMGWPLYISHLTRGKVCLKEEVAKELVIRFFEMLSKDSTISLYALINKIYENHHCNPSEEPAPSMKKSLPLYVFNALAEARKYLDDKQFADFREMVLVNLYLPPNDPLCNILGQLLISQKISFNLLSACLQLFSLNLYMDETFEASVLPQVVMRNHCGSLALQVTIPEEAKTHTLLVPLNLNMALDCIQKELPLLPAEVLDLLGSFYTLMKPTRSELRIDNRLRKYCSGMQITPSLMLQRIVALFEGTASAFAPFIMDLFASLSSIDESGLTLKNWLNGLPHLIATCGDVTHRCHMCRILLELLTASGQLSSASTFGASLMVLAVDENISADKLLEELSFAIAALGREELLSDAFRLFQSCNSQRFEEFINIIWQTESNIAVQALKYAAFQAVLPCEEVFDIASRLLEASLFTPDQQVSLSDLLTTFLERNDPFLDELYLPLALKFVEKIGVKSQQALTEKVLSKARNASLNPFISALSMRLQESYLDFLIRQSSESELKELVQRYGHEESDGELATRCKLIILSRQLKGPGPFSKGLLDQFSTLLQTENWRVFKRDIISCYDLLICKALGSNKNSCITLVGYFTKNPTVRQFFDACPDSVIIRSLFDLMQNFSRNEERHIIDLIALCLHLSFCAQVTANEKIENLQHLMGILETLMPSTNLQQVLAPHVSSIVGLIRNASLPFFLFRFFKLCDTHNVLLNDVTENMNGCLWALDACLEPSIFSDYQRIMRCLLGQHDPIVVADGIQFEKFVAAVLDKSQFISTPQQCLYWLEILARYEEELSISPEKILQMLDLIQQGSDKRVKSQVWPLITGVLKDKSYFTKHPRAKENAFMTAIYCLIESDSEACYELLSSNSPSVIAELDHCPTEAFIESFMYTLLRSAILRLKSRSNVYDPQKLSLLFYRRNEALQKGICSSGLISELDVLLIQNLYLCSSPECHNQLWFCLNNVYSHLTENSDALLLDLFYKLIQRKPLFNSSTPRIVFRTTLKHLLTKFTGNFNLTLLFQAVANLHSNYNDEEIISILSLIEELTYSGYQFDLPSSRLAFEELIMTMLQQDNLMLVELILNSDLVKRILNHLSETKPVSHSSSSTSKNKKRNKSQRSRQATNNNILLHNPYDRLRIALFEKTITNLMNSLCIDTNFDYTLLLDMVFKQISHLLLIDPDCKFLSILLNVMYSIFDVNKDTEKFRDRIDQLFKLINEHIFDPRELQLSDGARSPAMMSLVLGLGSSQSIPSTLSSVTFNHFLRPLTDIRLSESFTQKKSAYVKYVAFFASSLIDYKMKNEELALFSEKILFQVFEYIYDFHLPLIHTTYGEELLKTLFTYLFGENSFRSELVLVEHQTYCKSLIRKYKDFIDFSKLRDGAMSIFVIDPQLVLQFKAQHKFIERVYYLLKDLLKRNTPTSLGCVMEILKLCSMELFSSMPEESTALFKEIIAGCITYPYVRYQGNSFLKSLVELICSMSAPPAILGKIFLLQQTLVSSLLEKSLYYDFSLEMLKEHFELCVNFMVKQCQMGTFIKNVHCFRLTLLKLKLLAKCLAIKDQTFPVQLKIKIFVNICMAIFKQNSQCRELILIFQEIFPQ